MVPQSNSIFPSMYHIPGELVEIIIKQLAEDKYALERCALVSRGFRALSQKQLFHHIKITDSEESARLHDVLVRSPHLAHNIRDLWLIVSTISDGNLVSVLSFMKNLSTFRLERDSSSIAIGWSGLSSDLRQAFARVLQLETLTTLKLENWEFESDAEAYEFLSHGAHINTLTVSFQIRKFLSTQKPVRRIALRSLSLSLPISAFGTSSKWIYSPYCIYDLTSLESFYLGFVCHVFEFGKFVQLTGQSLLRLTVEYSPLWQLLGIFLDFRRLPALQYFCYDMCFANESTLNQLVSCLGTIETPNCLKEVEIIVDQPELSTPNSSHISTDLWTGIDDTFSQPKFGGLEKLSIIASVRDGVVESEIKANKDLFLEALKRQLPKVAQNLGIHLTVDYSFDLSLELVLHRQNV